MNTNHDTIFIFHCQLSLVYLKPQIISTERHVLNFYFEGTVVFSFFYNTLFEVASFSLLNNLDMTLKTSNNKHD